jgi:hypothetical protein
MTIFFYVAHILLLHSSTWSRYAYMSVLYLLSEFCILVMEIVDLQSSHAATRGQSYRRTSLCENKSPGTHHDETHPRERKNRQITRHEHPSRIQYLCLFPECQRRGKRPIRASSGNVNPARPRLEFNDKNKHPTIHHS